MQVRREVLGDEHVDRANAAITDVTRDFQELLTRYPRPSDPGGSSLQPTGCPGWSRSGWSTATSSIPTAGEAESTGTRRPVARRRLERETRCV